MEDVVSVVTDVLTILGAMVSVYLALGIAVAFLEGQMDALTGRPAARDIGYRVALLIVCAALVALARGVSDDVAALVADELTDQASVRGAVLNVGQYALDVLIGSAALLMAVGVVTGFVGAQLATMAGEPLMLSRVLGKLTVIMALAAGAFLTITLTHIVVDALR
jgi:hypothetical protein